MEYRLAKDVAVVGRELIEEHHPHLLGVRVEFVFMDKTPRAKGKDVWGRAKKISGLSAFLADEHGLREDYDPENPQEFFVVEVSEEVWERLTAKGRRALVDHELSHLDIAHDDDGNVKLAVVGHDITEFEGVLRRHGLWNETVEDFVKAGAEQLTLEGGEGAEDEVTTTIAYKDQSFTFAGDELERVAEGGRHLRTVGAESR